MEQTLIDRFVVPAAAVEEFSEQVVTIRKFLETLPGLRASTAYGRTESDGAFVCLTVAVWESEDALLRAKDAVQAEYARRGFDPQEMIRRLGIAAERGVYTEIL